MAQAKTRDRTHLISFFRSFFLLCFLFLHACRVCCLRIDRVFSCCILLSSFPRFFFCWLFSILFIFEASAAMRTSSGLSFACISRRLCSLSNLQRPSSFFESRSLFRRKLFLSFLVLPLVLLFTGKGRRPRPTTRKRNIPMRRKEAR